MTENSIPVNYFNIKLNVASSENANNVSIDLETYSSVPIKKAGAQAYIRSPDFEILLFAYSLDGQPPEIIDFASGEILPEWLRNALTDPELQAVIEPTTIRQVLHGEESISEDKLFLLSKTQVFGKGDWSEAEPDDTHLDIFPTERSRVKECGDNGTYWWWLRSPISSYTTTFCGVSSIGTSGNNGNASSSYGVAFGFCI